MNRGCRVYFHTLKIYIYFYIRLKTHKCNVIIHKVLLIFEFKQKCTYLRKLESLNIKGPYVTLYEL